MNPGSVSPDAAVPQPVPAPAPTPPPRPVRKDIELEIPEVELRIPEAKEEKKPLPNKEDAEREVEELNKELEGLKTRLKFGLFNDTDQFFVEVVDRQNNEVIAVIPPIHLLELRQRLQEGFSLLMDQKA